MTFTAESIENQSWSKDSTVLVEIFDEADSEYDPIVLRFEVSDYTQIIWDFVEFKQVN